MPYEIEHKYLVINDSYKEMAVNSLHIRQGYLSRDIERTVRVRIRGDKGYLTVKGRTENAKRLEFEYEIPVAEAKELLKLCPGRIIDKTRYFIPYGGYVWEVDDFHGDLAPKTVAEIELPSEKLQYSLPPFVGMEVTGDPAYYNSML